MRPLIAMVAVLIALSVFGCSEPKRPTEVPALAVRVDSAKTWYWKGCEALAGGVVRCTIWNAGGTVLVDEAYVLRDSGLAPAAGNLRLLEAPCSGPYEVCLVNRQILVPESMFERMRSSRQRN